MMTYDSVVVVNSRLANGVTYTVAKVSFERRLELMRKIRDLARRLEYLEAGKEAGDRMDAAVLRAEIDRTYIIWGLQGVSGLEVDGEPATPEALAARAGGAVPRGTERRPCTDGNDKRRTKK